MADGFALPADGIVATPVPDTAIGNVEEIVVGLSWDMFDPSNAVDLDASCVVFNEYGFLQDAVFYNQLSIPGVRHSGDNVDGQGEGFDETITISLGQVDESICAFVIVVSCYEGGTFQQVETASASILVGGSSQPLVDVSLGVQGEHESLVLAIVYRQPGHMDWQFKNVGRPVLSGRTFQAVEAEMREELEFLIPKELQDEARLNLEATRTFNLTKGSGDYRLTGLRKVFLGLGWDSRCDLDAGVIEINNGSTKGTVINYSSLKNDNESIVHSGDNTTGEGEGDDETIVVDLREVPSTVSHLFFVINIYTTGTTFSQVEGAFVRLVNADSNQEICRYTLDGSHRSRGMLMCCVFRDPTYSRIWRMQALGLECPGQTAREEGVWRTIRTALPNIRASETTATSGSSSGRKRRGRGRRSTPTPTPPSGPRYVFQCHAIQIDKKDVFGLSDPYFYILNENREIYRSPTLKVTLNPNYEEDSFPIDSAQPQDRLLLRMFDWDRFSSDDFIGEFEFCIRDVMAGQETEYILLNQAKRGSDKGAGTFVFDFIRQQE